MLEDFKARLDSFKAKLEAFMARLYAHKARRETFKARLKVLNIDGNQKKVIKAFFQILRPRLQARL